MREEMILRKMRSADPEGLEQLMERYIPYVSAVVWNILRYSMTPQDAEEVVSDVFLAAWNQAAEIQSGSAKAWLGAVARNKARTKLRQTGQTLPLEEDVLDNASYFGRIFAVNRHLIVIAFVKANCFTIKNIYCRVN